MRQSRRRSAWLAVFAVIAAGSIACGGTASLPPVPTAASGSAETQPAQQAAPKPTEPPPPTPTPAPRAYKEPVVLAEVGGTGGIVTDNYKWPECQKAVFIWTVNAASSGAASLILKLHKSGVEDNVTLVNEFAMDLSGKVLSGSSLLPLDGGEYFFSSENTDKPWTVRVECQDGVKPVGEGLDIQATGNMVTDNYSLPACQKSVFSWTAASKKGSAALIIHLCGRQCETIVNEFQMDVPDGIKGDALQSVDGGVYYLTSENTGNREWTVKWECRD